MKMLWEKETRGEKFLKRIKLWFIVVLIFSLSFIIIDYAETYFINRNNNIESYNWNTFDILDIGINKPVEYRLEEVEPETPEYIIPYVEDDKLFEYQKDDIYFFISSIKYNNLIEPDMRYGYLEMLDSLQSNNIEIKNFNEENYFLKNEEAIRFSFNFNLGENKTSFTNKGLVFSHNDRYYMITFVYNSRYSSLNEVANKIIDSVNLY